MSTALHATKTNSNHDDYYYISAQPMPTLNRQCPLLHYQKRIRQAKLKIRNRSTEELDRDSLDNEDNSDLENDASVANLQKDVNTIDTFFEHERQVLQKLSSAAIRSANVSTSAAGDKLLALMHRWQEIHLLLSIETLRREAHLRHRNGQATPLPLVRSVLSLEHFPRTVTTVPNNKTKNNSVNRLQTQPKRQIKATHKHPQPTKRSLSSSSSAWEGTVYKHKLLTSLYFKLSLKLVFTALQVFAQQQRQRRRMVSSVPILRERKLLQVAFISLLKNQIDSLYLERKSDATAKDYILNKSIRPLVRQWYVKAHSQSPRQRRLYVAAIAYHEFRRKQLTWEKYFQVALHRVKMRKWGQVYRRRSGMLHAWLAWRYAFMQKHHWRTSMYERFTGNRSDKSMLSSSKADWSAIDLSQSHVSQATTVKQCQALLHQEQSMLRQRLTPLAKHTLPESDSFLRSGQFHSHLYDSLNTTGHNSLLIESPSISKRRNVFNSVKESRFSQNTMDASYTSKHKSSSLSRAGADCSGLHMADISGYVSDDSLSDPAHPTKSFPVTLSPLTPGTANGSSQYQHQRRSFYSHSHSNNNDAHQNNRSDNNSYHNSSRYHHSQNNESLPPFSPTTVSFASPIAKYQLPVSPSPSPSPSSTRYKSHNTSSFVSYPMSPHGLSGNSIVTSASSVTSQRSKLIEDIISLTSEDILSHTKISNSNHSNGDKRMRHMNSHKSLHKNDSISSVSVTKNNDGSIPGKKMEEEDTADFPHGNEDDIDPLNSLPVTQRDAVFRFLQERRSKWYFQQCQRFLQRTLATAHRRRAFHLVHHQHCRRHRQKCWVAWQACHQKKLEEARLCDAIHAFRHMKRHFQAWRHRFDPIHQLYLLHSEWLGHRKVKRLLRRRFQLWHQLWRERTYESHAIEAVKQGVARRVFGGWRSVIGQWQYTKRAEKVLYMKRLRPFFTSWKTKCQQKCLLRRVFTVQEHAWSVRAVANSPHAVHQQAFHILHSFFHAWNGYMREKKLQRFETRYYSLALCFRGASLLARHFIAWKTYHRKYRRLHAFYQRRQEAFLKRTFGTWRRYIVQVVKPETQRLQEKYHFRFVSNLWSQWEAVLQMRRTQLRTLIDIQGHWCMRHSWTQWRMAFKAKLLQKKLLLLTPKRTTSAAANVTDNNVWDISDTDSSSNSSSTTSRTETDKMTSFSRMSQLQQLTQQVQESLKPYKEPPQQASVRFQDSIAQNTSNIPDNNTVVTPVWTQPSQKLRAKRYFRIWRQFFYRVTRYQRGFRLLENYFYRKKMHNCFLHWPGRRQIVKAEQMRSFLLAKATNPSTAFSRLQLVEYDPDELKRTKELHHTETRQRAQEQAWEDELFHFHAQHNTLSSHQEKARRQEYLFLKQQRAEKLNRDRKQNPFSQNVVATRSFLQKSPPTLNELAYLLGYVQKIPDAEGLLRIKDLLSTLLFHWKRYIEREKALRLCSVEVRQKTRAKVLLTSLRKWIATTPRVSYRIVTWLNNAAERRAFLDAQRWAEHGEEGEKEVHEAMECLRIGT